MFEDDTEYEQAEEKVLGAYSSVLKVGLGNLVLEDMLFELYFTRPAETPEQQALCNYAKALLAKIYPKTIPKSVMRRLIEVTLHRLRRRKK